MYRPILWNMFACFPSALQHVNHQNHRVPGIEDPKPTYPPTTFSRPSKPGGPPSDYRDFGWSSSETRPLHHYRGSYHNAGKLSHDDLQSVRRPFADADISRHHFGGQGVNLNHIDPSRKFQGDAFTFGNQDPEYWKSSPFNFSYDVGDYNYGSYNYPQLPFHRGESIPSEEKHGRFEGKNFHSHIKVEQTDNGGTAWSRAPGRHDTGVPRNRHDVIARTTPERGSTTHHHGNLIFLGAKKETTTGNYMKSYRRRSKGFYGFPAPPADRKLSDNVPQSHGEGHTDARFDVFEVRSTRVTDQNAPAIVPKRATLFTPEIDKGNENTSTFNHLGHVDYPGRHRSLASAGDRRNKPEVPASPRSKQHIHIGRSKYAAFPVHFTTEPPDTPPTVSTLHQKKGRRLQAEIDASTQARYSRNTNHHTGVKNGLGRHRSTSYTPKPPAHRQVKIHYMPNNSNHELRGGLEEGSTSSTEYQRTLDANDPTSVYMWPGDSVSVEEIVSNRNDESVTEKNPHDDQVSRAVDAHEYSHLNGPGPWIPERSLKGSRHDGSNRRSVGINQARTHEHFNKQDPKRSRTSDVGQSVYGRPGKRYPDYISYKNAQNVRGLRHGIQGRPRSGLAIPGGHRPYYTHGMGELTDDTTGFDQEVHLGLKGTVSNTESLPVNSRHSFYHNNQGPVVFNRNGASGHALNPEDAGNFQTLTKDQEARHPSFTIGTVDQSQQPVPRPNYYDQDSGHHAPYPGIPVSYGSGRTSRDSTMYPARMFRDQKPRRTHLQQAFRHSLHDNGRRAALNMRASHQPNCAGRNCERDGENARELWENRAVPHLRRSQPFNPRRRTSEDSRSEAENIRTTAKRPKVTGGQRVYTGGYNDTPLYQYLRRKYKGTLDMTPSIIKSEIHDMMAQDRFPSYGDDY